MATRRGRAFRPLLIGVLCLLIGGVPALAARSRSLGLQDMARRAGRIFVGHCTQVRVDAGGGGISVTTYTFEVSEPIKGVRPGSVTFRVPGTPERPLFAGMPAYQEGQEALLLLYPESQAGFSTAIGLDQGSFRVDRGEAGNAALVNGNGNVDLLRDVPEGLLNSHGLDRGARGPLRLDRVLPILRSLAEGQP